MFEKENRDRLRENVLNDEEYFKIREKKSKMENDLRFFKLHFAEMVFQKEEALFQLGSAKQALTELEAELEKTNLADHARVHQHTSANLGN